MDVLTDDHEREQVVRKWWHENWLSLTVGIVIAIALMIGYKQYQVYKNDKAAANAYEMSQIQTALVLKPTESIEKAQAFIKEHEDIYGSLLSLDLASTYIAQKDYDNLFCMDIVCVEEWFEDTDEFKWLMQHADDYGFILRYPSDKENITKVIYEPWHWRYVGVEEAKKIKASGLCLEEYFGKE